MLIKPISIDKFDRGMKVSPFEGFSQLRGIDPFKVKGVASIDRKPIAITAATTAVDRVLWTVVANDGTIYFLDATGKVFTTTVGAATYSIITGNTTTSANGNGFAYWKGCLWVTRNQKLDYYDLSAATWHNDFQTLKVSYTGPNPIFAGQDDKLYIGNDHYIAVLSETSAGSFTPSTGAGVSFDDDTLILPKDYKVNCFAELGDKLMIGTLYGTDTTNPNKTADIFPWSRDTTQSFTQPIRIGDEGVNSMITSNNLLYISAGIKGNVYVTNGASTQLLFSVPLDSKENSNSTITRFSVKPDAFDFVGEELLLGITQSSAYSVAPTHNPIGVFGYQNGATRFIGNGSYGKDGSDGTLVRITSIYSISPSIFYVGWWSGSTSGIDYYGTNNDKITSYGAYMETEMFIVGSYKNSATIEDFNFYLSKDLVSGDGIRLSYRTSTDDSYTTIATMDFATHGAINAYTFHYSIPGLSTVQFKIELNATSTTTPELRAIICQ